MAPQTSIPVAANVLGVSSFDLSILQVSIEVLLGDWVAQSAQTDNYTSPAATLVFWCVQLIPQIWTNWRTKTTEGLPALMMFLWGVCGVPFGAYAIIQNFNVPIQVQPQVFMVLCLISWVQILIYGNKWSTKKAVSAGLIMAALFGGIEAALILTLKPIYERGNEAPALVVGIIASIFLAAGLIPPYFEIYKRRGRVAGINFVFLGMDWCGAFFSLMALVAQNTFDILGGVLYVICALLEIGIFMSHIIWMIRTRKIRKRAKEEGKTFDELAAEIVAVEGDSWPFAERLLHPIFTSVWWRNRFTGKAMRPDPETTRDEEQAMPNEKAFDGAQAPTNAATTSAPAPEYESKDGAIANSRPAACTGGVTWSEEAGDRGSNSAYACDDTSRSCSDSVAPTQCGDADAENEFDDKR
ncbi:hypothetical protein SBRCBS47491_005557 [Sporothrix bragantina]|uniref:PQ loop repeat protein n=1 Tax=Sporothrix bragantina TaxID=671064 RepID=A0ABP0BXX8_9PEZI